MLKQVLVLCALTACSAARNSYQQNSKYNKLSNQLPTFQSVFEQSHHYKSAVARSASKNALAG
jgi:hypothetical protein